jgi:hypothetical protein
VAIGLHETEREVPQKYMHDIVQAR